MKLRKQKQENPQLALNITFSDNNSESGAMLTWKHLYPNIKPPMLVEYVSDGDLWTFNYGYDTNYFYSGMLANNRQPKEVPKDYWIQLLHDTVELNKVIEKDGIPTLVKNPKYKVVPEAEIK
jgi:oligoribonuclease NrnB/cAMP/cGMP phosphodiesterase (DHH superfamily)